MKWCPSPKISSVQLLSIAGFLESFAQGYRPFSCNDIVEVREGLVVIIIVAEESTQLLELVF